MQTMIRILALSLLLVHSFAAIRGATAHHCIYSMGDKLAADCRNNSLTSVPQNLKEDIIELDLSNNMIHSLKPFIFMKYTMLQSIILQKNNIHKIHDSAFVGLNSLRVLNLRDNILNISNLSHQLFINMKNIVALDMTRNLRASNQNHKPYVYPDKAFSYLVSLQNLSVDMYPFPVFRKGFSKLMHLSVLRFDHCYIRELTNKTFIHFSSSVTAFYLTNCKHFFPVESGVLQPFPKLDILDLSVSFIHLTQALQLLYPLRNKNMSVINFRQISDSTVNNDNYSYAVIVTREMMTYLKTICVKALDLSKTGIVDFQIGSLFSFDYPLCFSTFIISMNRLPLDGESHVHDVVLFYMQTKNIKIYDFSYLTLEYNNPTYLDVFNKGNNYWLQNSKTTIKKRGKDSSFKMTINLHSSLEFVRVRNVMASNNLPMFVCSNSSLKYLDISYSMFESYPQFSYTCGRKLEYLDASGISCTLMPERIETFPSLKTLLLVSVDLHKRDLRRLPLFGFTPSLKYLDVSFNDMHFLDEKVFTNHSFLEHLNMSNNFFKTLPLAVTELTKIKSLDISNNLITSINKTIRIWLENMFELDQSFSFNLSNNPLICSCDSVDFLIWLGETRIVLNNQYNYTCTMQNGTEVKIYDVVDDVHAYFSHCSSYTWLRIGISLIATFFGVGIPFSLIYGYRWKIIFFIYRKFRVVVERGLNLNYQYDLYVSYDDSSVSWIKHHLYPKVEKEWGLKMFIEDRDLLAGDNTADAKAESIHRSRHILFILTKHFIDCQWGRYEIERAKYEQFTKNERKIIVVARDVKMKDIPQAITNIWRDVLFIEWPNKNNTNEVDFDTFTNSWLKLKTFLFLNQ